MTQKLAYIGAESDAAGNRKWHDGSEWDYVSEAYLKHANNENKIAVVTQGVWWDWGMGDWVMGVVCREELPRYMGVGQIGRASCRERV